MNPTSTRLPAAFCFPATCLATVALLLALAIPVASAADTPAAPAPATSATAPKADFAGDPYLLGVDPLGDKLPDAPIPYSHEGRELRFASQKNLDAFKADPAKYLPKVDELMIAQQLPFYPTDKCLVSDDKLGGEMGPPINLIYKNRLVRFCCKSCIKDFEKDPAKVIAEINAAVIAKQGPKYPLAKCPVSDEKLGEMGDPVEKVYGNRLIKFCCGSCVKDFNKNPAKYLKILDTAALEKEAKEEAIKQRPPAIPGDARK